MGTTAEKLAYLADTKTAIKDAIVAKGVEVPEGTTFRGYAGLISGISTGLSDADLALATATPEDVTAGKTFYAGNRTLKTGEKIFSPPLTLKQVFDGKINPGESKTFTINSKTFVAIGTGWCNGIIPVSVAFVNGVNVKSGNSGGDGTGLVTPGNVYKGECYVYVTQTASGYTLKISTSSDNISDLDFDGVVSATSKLYILEG